MKKVCQAPLRVEKKIKKNRRSDDLNMVLVPTFLAPLPDSLVWREDFNLMARHFI